MSAQESASFRLNAFKVGIITKLTQKDYEKISIQNTNEFNCRNFSTFHMKYQPKQKLFFQCFSQSEKQQWLNQLTVSLETGVQSEK